MVTERGETGRISIHVDVDPEPFRKHSKIIMQDDCSDELLCFGQILGHKWTCDKPLEWFKCSTVADSSFHRASPILLRASVLRRKNSNLLSAALGK